MDHNASRAKCHAGARPLERWVRPRSGGAANRGRRCGRNWRCWPDGAGAAGARRTKQLTSLRARRIELAWGMRHLLANKPLERRSRYRCVRSSLRPHDEDGVLHRHRSAGFVGLTFVQGAPWFDELG